MRRTPHAVTFRIDDAALEALRRLAKARGLSRSALVRHALHGLSQHERQLAASLSPEQLARFTELRRLRRQPPPTGTAVRRGTPVPLDAHELRLASRLSPDQRKRFTQLRQARKGVAR